ncbi:prephenate dehydratase PHA2 [Aspergillus ibericus CBS 121593]|uniref:prephenate dehydratase n=1 Tax=Aspergillus ibericus CBS 121593 TaxID=1448316 RepID=A0A395HCG1_9EURO|nr:PDT-domain-containing protein [Aspergillus ibericus CBS 121593]RAL05651.1 PDT-domain-containing protein [Aspergillus ibericus CBS 121593]
MEPLKVAFLGPAASFSHQAAVESFGSSAELLPHVSFPDAFAAVQADRVDYAIIPCENSTNGSVVQTLDLLADPSGLYSDVKVCGEHYLTVHHCLLTRKGLFPPGQRDYSSITKLYTHPQAWGQCEGFLERTFKGIERQDVSSTSKGAGIVSKETTERSGAIASRFAAEYHGLDVSEENIEDKANNTTRFLVLRNVNSERTSRLSFGDVKVSPAQGPTSVTPTAQKTLISFMIRQDCPGALADALLLFKNQGMNLTSINSRPSQIRAWKYVFLVECQSVPSSENKDSVSEIIGGLQEVTDGCRHLGTWADQFVSV